MTFGELSCPLSQLIFGSIRRRVNFAEFNWVKPPHSLLNKLGTQIQVGPVSLLLWWDYLPLWLTRHSSFPQNKSPMQVVQHIACKSFLKSQQRIVIFRYWGERPQIFSCMDERKKWSKRIPWSSCLPALCKRSASSRAASGFTTDGSFLTPCTQKIEKNFFSHAAYDRTDFRRNLRWHRKQNMWKPNTEI